MSERNERVYVPGDPLDVSRFRALFSERAAARQVVYVIGCGNLGSWITLALAKLGVSTFALFDPDVVDASNVATQVYRTRDIGYHKVNALEVAVLYVSDSVTVIPHRSTYEAAVDAHEVPPTTSPYAPTLYVVAPDSLQARLSIWTAVKAYGEIDVPYIDVRMGARELDVIAFRIKRDDPGFHWYERDILDTRQTDLPCGARSIAYTGAFTAGVVGEIARRAMVEYAASDGAGTSLEPWRGTYTASLETFEMRVTPFDVRNEGGA